MRTHLLYSHFTFLAKAYPELFSFKTPTLHRRGGEADERRGTPATTFMLMSSYANKIVCGVHSYGEHHDNLHPLWEEYFSFYMNPEEKIALYAKESRTPHELYALEAWYRMMLLGGGNPQHLPPLPEGALMNPNLDNSPIFIGSPLIPYDRNNIKRIDNLNLPFDSKLVLLASVHEKPIPNEELVELAGVPSIFVSKILDTDNLIDSIKDDTFFVFRKDSKYSPEPLIW